MKNSRVFKILLIIVIIAAIVGIALLIKNKGGKKASEEEVKIAEELMPSILSLKDGYAIKYNGKELLFENDKLEYSDLSKGNILLAASSYVVDHKLDNQVQTTILNSIEENYGYAVNDYTPFKGEAIRKAVKEFFNENWQNQSSIDETNFGYNFIYIEEFDVYLKGRNESFAYPSSDAFVKTLIVETTTDKDDLKVEIAVAYVIKDNGEYQYNKDVQGSKTVYTTKEIENIDEKKADDFEHYIVTLTKNGDNYSFKSIAKK